MDTDNLTNKAYRAIIGEAERFNHDLTLQFGLLSYECKNEREYITMAARLAREMLKYDEDAMDDIFFGNPPQKEEFHAALKKILNNISKLPNATPL